MALYLEIQGSLDGNGLINTFSSNLLRSAVFTLMSARAKPSCIENCLDSSSLVTASSSNLLRKAGVIQILQGLNSRCDKPHTALIKNDMKEALGVYFRASNFEFLPVQCLIIFY